MIGNTISHYRIIDKLGAGGMGVVYKAKDTRLQRTVALKFLSKDFTHDEEAKLRFAKEAQAAAALNHPNICTIHEIDEYDDQSFIVMEYIKGQSLRDKLYATPAPLAIAEIIDIADQISAGLREAHEMDIVHRDIKSANIMISEKGQVKIMDFGLAKLMSKSRLTREGTTLGTVAYMSPEQVSGEDVDNRTDIWSFGVVLYEMISGSLPFLGEYDQVIFYAIINKEARPLTEKRTGVPVELEKVVNKALAKEPAKRYQHVDEIQDDMKRLGKVMEISGLGRQPDRIKEKGVRKKRLQKLALFTVFLIVVVLCLLIFRPSIMQETFLEPIPIAVIGFENQTGDRAYDHYQKVIPNFLITKLEQSKSLRVNTWERMYDLLGQLGKKDTEIIDSETGFELCKLDGIDAIVLGSYAKTGDIFAIDVKILDVNSKDLLKSAGTRGEGETSIFRQIDELGKEISREMGLSERTIEADQRAIVEVTTNSMEAYNYFLRGRDDYEKLYFDDALQFLEKAIELDSTFAVAHLYQAWTYGELKNIQARNQSYRKAKIVSGKATEKERLYVDAAYARIIERNPAKRFQILKQLSERYPKEKRAHYFLAVYYRDKNNFTKAIEEFNKAIELDPHYGIALNDLAFAYVDMEDFEKALEYFQKYASVSPGDANPFDSMGELFFIMGNLDKAIEKYSEALEVRPDYYNAYWRVAYIHAMSENYPETMRYMDQFLAVVPSDGLKAMGHMWRGFYYYWLGNLHHSLGELQKTADLWEKVGNEFGQAYVNWLQGFIYCDHGKFEQSRKVFNRWYNFVERSYPDKIAVNSAGYNFYLGLVDLKDGQLDSAKTRLDKITIFLSDLTPATREIICRYHDFLYCEILMAENNADSTLVVWAKRSLPELPAMSTGPMISYNMPPLRDISARANEQKGETDKAIAEYEYLITFDPNTKERYLIHPIYHYRLAQLYEKKGRSEKAIAQYRKFLGICRYADCDRPERSIARSRVAKLQKGM